MLKALASPLHAPENNLTRLALFLLLWMPLWFVIGRAWADIAVCIIAGLFLLHTLCYSRWQWCSHIEARLLLLFYLYMVLQYMLVSTDTHSWFKALSFGRILLFYLALRFWLWTNRSAMFASLCVALPVLFLVALDTYWQYATGTSLTGQGVTGHELNRLTGPLSHPNIGNYFLKIGLPMMACAFFFNSHYKKSTYAMLALLLAYFMMIIPLSGERSTVAMLLVAGVATIIAAYLRMRPYRRQIGVITLIIFGMVALVAMQPVVQERSALLMDQLANFSDTAYGQLLKANVLLVEQHMFFGIGARHFYEACQLLYDAQLVSYCDIHPHNMYLQWLVETGLFGLVIFLLFIGTLLVKVARIYVRTRHLKLISLSMLIGSMLGILFPLIITQNNFGNWPATIFWYALALHMSAISLHDDRRIYG